MHFCWNISQHSCEAGRSGEELYQSVASAQQALLELSPHGLQSVSSSDLRPGLIAPEVWSSVSPVLSFLLTKRVADWMVADTRESWWCQLWSLLIKTATMPSCWDLTWCPSYLQITFHIVQSDTDSSTTTLPHLLSVRLILFKIK